ncbi:37S ribosomal protein rsm18 [Drechslerella dactyloides]|uniref:Small ribosomal subunit protein bS18m n=1 Tax=Drechslerella dactyloides TaxID=74499 RepID=A0AAD6IXK1_DREDA|nr:37S ribosomal protein rsm18 [Drechslerella dactyloides]
MPPRTATTLVRAITRDGPILPFLYPAASRRLLSSSAPRQQNDDGPTGPPGASSLPDRLAQSMIKLKNLPQQRQNSALPTLPEESVSSSSGPANGAGSVSFQGMMRDKRAFETLNTVNGGTEVLVGRLRELATKRMDLERATHEKIDPDVYRFQAPFKTGTYMNPHDMSYEQYEKYIQSRRFHLKEDIFEILQESPMKYYKNFNLLKDFMTSAGRIKHRSVTGLSNANQRKMAKAIRRAIGIGFLPSVHYHPSALMKEQKYQAEGYKEDRSPRGDRSRADALRDRLSSFS